MNNSCNNGVVSICNNSKNNDGSLDDEITLLETTLIDSTNEKINLPKSPNNQINFVGSSLENVVSDNLEVNDTTSDINLSMQLTYPANPSILSSIQHIGLADKQIISSNSSYSVVGKSVSVPFTLATTSDNLKSFATVQNKDCDIIISQCDSSLEGINLFTDTTFKSGNFDIQSTDVGKGVIPNNDDEVDFCKSSKSDNDMPLDIDIGSKILSGNAAFAQENKMSEIVFQNMPVGEEMTMENNITKLLPKNNIQMDDCASDEKGCTLLKSHCSHELNNDNEPQVEQHNGFKLVNVVSDICLSGTATTSNSNEKTEIKESKEICVNECSGEKQNKSTIYCSTPITVKNYDLNLKSKSRISNHFGLVSPLISSIIKSKSKAKRKIEHLDIIEEVDDEEPDNIVRKKLKCDEYSESDKNLESKTKGDKNIPTLSSFETPATTILKLWQPTCLPRTSSAQYLVLDEITESECEAADHRENVELADKNADDFELAYKSLIDELMENPSDIETLEKYHSQIQLESQMDDEKFDEAFLELTQKFELGDKTCLSLRSMDQSTLKETDKTIIHATSLDISVDNTKADTSEGDKTAVEMTPSLTAEKSDKVVGGRSSVTVIKLVDESFANLSSSTNASKDIKQSDQPCSSKQEALIVYADKKDLAMDEEDVLLEKEIDAGIKPYKFVEYISQNAKENEDNYNPEWQKLGKLTTDEERYKAVRDRWRSLVPPDPNKNLTCRQWRKKNNLPPLNIGSFNNNVAMGSESLKNQHCNAVFEAKIEKIIKELEDRRMAIMYDKRRAFAELSKNQDYDHRVLVMRGCSDIDLSNLIRRHMMECQEAQERHMHKLKMIEIEADKRIKSLKTASEEVMAFQKYYRGVGDTREVNQFLSNIEVQELLETEDMLEQYTKFYC